MFEAHATNMARVIVMKAGVHDGESWADIVERKLAEQAAVGVAFWGYGGSACHPLTQVQPFALEDAQQPVQVIMVPTPSVHRGLWVPADSYSDDGSHWTPIPVGIVTTGTFALVLRNLQLTRAEFDLGEYEVAVGPNAGRPLPLYLRGRVDKACARRASRPAERAAVSVVMSASLAAPYAVVLHKPPPETEPF